jgi:hypothetical protein
MNLCEKKNYKEKIWRENYKPNRVSVCPRMRLALKIDDEILEIQLSFEAITQDHKKRNQNILL